ncbi:MAG: molybdenum cofactor guanylyltransferase [Bacteroidota bacterium]
MTRSINRMSDAAARSPVIAIMAGGRGRRMGRDKTAIVIDGATMLERVARAALATGRRVIISGRPRPDLWPLDDMEFIPDAVFDRGPLAGIVAALNYTSSPVIAIAADMPLVTTEAIAWLINISAESEVKDGLVVINNGRMEPLFSLYHPRVLPLAEKLLADNRLALRELIESRDFLMVDAPYSVVGLLRNINTPWELDDITETRNAREIKTPECP